VNGNVKHKKIEEMRMGPITEQAASTGVTDVTHRLMFFKNLQTVTNKIHATSNIDEIMLELSADISALFDADRLTIYTISEDKGSIVSRVKTGLNSFRDLRLAIDDHSIAGYVASSRAVINIADVYDELELQAIHPRLHFLKEVDRRSGYRTKQMLVAPIVDESNDELLGVVQIINRKDDTSFSPVAVEGIKGLCETMAIAFAQRNRPMPLVRSKYDYLVADAVVAVEELDLAKRTARRKHIDIEEVLIGDLQVNIEVLGAALSKFFEVPYESYRAERLRPTELLRNLKRDFLEQNQWLPIDEGRDGIVILTPDPERVKTARVVNNVFTRARLVYRVTTMREFKQTLDQFFVGGSLTDSTTVGDLLSGLDDAEIEIDRVEDAASAAADNELVKLVNKIIVEAYQQGASDIHIEPGPGKEKTVVRFRKDGTLVPYIEVPASYRNAIVARLKIMCDLDISERRKPQDGKIKFRKFGPLDIELRVATIPSAGGVEDVVLRMLGTGEPMPLDKLDVLPDNLKRLTEVIRKPYGLFFVCGPTGSGKTTTLHSVLSRLNTPEVKIWTAEDPVEITQKGLRQVQVNKKAGLDFPNIMRAFLRADPDVIMVGEMRDRETAAIGVEASLTGHLVLTTLHTNTAPESVIRLLDMGMDPFNFSDALLGILAQRLAKRLCVKCKQPYTASADEMNLFFEEYCEELPQSAIYQKDPEAAVAAVQQELRRLYANDKGQFTLCRPKGCPECGNTGYKGRLGLHELMIGTDRIKRIILEHGHVFDLFSAALDDGMKTLKMDGMQKTLLGLTDLKQVRAVCIK
jgi:type II secretory ATPase GspE/PulE/Tfp pilus assembly ATPase PilB-like protein